MSVLYIQEIASWKRELEAPSVNKHKTRMLQEYESNIKRNKESIEDNERALSLEREVLQRLLPSSPGK